MATTTNISWTDATWNVARGCSKVDADCKFCYMFRDSTRFGYAPRTVTQTKTVFDLPLRLKTPSRVFVSSLTDFFHPDCDGFRGAAWDIMRRCPQHTFQVLTKRPERIAAHLPSDWGTGWGNVWLGTSVGHQAALHRLESLLAVPSLTRFCSFEPLWERVDVAQVDTAGLHWAILGGESGNETGTHRYRPCRLEWLESLATGLQAQGVAVFVKQLGTALAKEHAVQGDRVGAAWESLPVSLQLRQFP